MPGIDAFTMLMLHMDGADASTTFTDSSLSPITVTPHGDAQIDTAQSKFGGASALFDGTGDDVSADGSAGFAFGTGDFTIDCWVRFASVSGIRSICDFRSAILTDPPRFILTAGNLAFIGGGITIASGLTVLSTNTWYHVAVARSGTTTKLFLDGTLEGSGTDGNDYGVGVARPMLGLSGLTGTNGLSGWIDELRISKGVARWTADFTPPTAPYDTGLAYSFSAAAGAFTLSGQNAVLVRPVAAASAATYRTLPSLVRRRSFLPSLGV